MTKKSETTRYFTAEMWRPVIFAATLLAIGAASALLLTAGSLWVLHVF